VDLEQKYLLNPNKMGAAHLWKGDDSVCRMYSTGGLVKHKYITTNDLGGRAICQLCKHVAGRKYVGNIGDVVVRGVDGVVADHGTGAVGSSHMCGRDGDDLYRLGRGDVKDRIETWQEMLMALRDAMNSLCNEHQKFTRDELQDLLQSFRAVVEAEHHLHKLLGRME